MVFTYVLFHFLLLMSRCFTQLNTDYWT